MIEEALRACETSRYAHIYKSELLERKVKLLEEQRKECFDREAKLLANQEAPPVWKSLIVGGVVGGLSWALSPNEPAKAAAIGIGAGFLIYLTF